MDHTRSRATIALLRPWIGTVKRHQATVAIAAVDQQYETGLYRARPHRYVAPPQLPQYARSPATADRERLDRAWAAGFLDAEGYFGLVRGPSRAGGRPWYRIRASASQHGEPGRPAAVLRRLHAIVDIGRIERHGEPDDFKWVAEGLPALEHVLTVVGPWLGAVKREQARNAIAAFTSQVRLKGGSSSCKRGHRYDRRKLTKAGRMRAYCNTCTRLRERRKRAGEGIAPRPFTDLARRYTE